MAENYKHLYEQTKKMLTMYQDELIPGYRKQIEDLEAKSKWIPVTERLPENTEKVIALSKSSFGNGYLSWLVRYNPDTGAFYDYDSEWGNIKIHNITHWMPLPEPPEEVE